MGYNDRCSRDEGLQRCRAALGRIADRLTRPDFLILDELRYLPFAQSAGQLLFHLVSRLIVTSNLTFAGRRGQGSCCFRFIRQAREY